MTRSVKTGEIKCSNCGSTTSFSIKEWIKSDNEIRVTCTKCGETSTISLKTDVDYMKSTNYVNNA